MRGGKRGTCSSDRFLPFSLLRKEPRSSESKERLLSEPQSVEAPFACAEASEEPVRRAKKGEADVGEGRPGSRRKGEGEGGGTEAPLSLGWSLAVSGASTWRPSPPGAAPRRVGDTELESLVASGARYTLPQVRSLSQSHLAAISSWCSPAIRANSGFTNMPVLYTDREKYNLSLPKDTYSHYSLTRTVTQSCYILC